MKLSNFKAAEPLEIIHEYLTCFNYAITLSGVEMVLVRVINNWQKCIFLLQIHALSDVQWKYFDRI